MDTSTNTFAFLFFLAFIFLLSNGNSAEGVENKQLYVIYLGDTKHDDPLLTEQSHHDLLGDVVGSKELAADLMVTNYKHGFSGFAAKLSESHAQAIAELPEVVHIFKNKMYELKTTRSWEYLGLPMPTPNNILGKTNQGEDVIIGVIDSGVWAQSESFSDEGIGPIPSRWKGTCERDDGDGSFDPAKFCNRKIIGARYYMDGFIHDDVGKDEVFAVKGINFNSPRDSFWHGTHVASIAAGNYVKHVNYKGLVHGTARGGAPKARLAIYKTCWAYNGTYPNVCSVVDILKAIDQAIEDGVDIIQASIGNPTPIFPEITTTNGDQDMAIGTFHAMTKGITVVLAAGNDGPKAETVSNVEPWTITVGAIYHDRNYPTPITLGNNLTLTVRGLNPRPETGFKELFMPEGADCESLIDLVTEKKTHFFEGKVVACFAAKGTELGPMDLIPENVSVHGLIVAKYSDTILKAFDYFPYLDVSYDIGTKILKYNQSTSNPVINIGQTKTVIDSGLPMVAHFSSRGPNSLAPEILKPDIVAPGANILAQGVPVDIEANDDWMLESGTSMAAPHISGIAALLKQAHPHWSPAAIKSAIMTTAWNINRYGLPILEEPSKKVADHFDVGAGIPNPDASYDPGLVYDMGVTDYVHYLCGMGYTNTSIAKVLTRHPTRCPTQKPSILNLNLPSITIPSLNNSTTVERTVTNVAHHNAVYKAVIDNPAGTVVSVQPKVLEFNSKVKKRSFKVTITALRHGLHTQGYMFGSLTWTDGDHKVRSPISVQL